MLQILEGQNRTSQKLVVFFPYLFFSFFFFFLEASLANVAPGLDVLSSLFHLIAIVYLH